MGWKHTALSLVRRAGGLRIVEALYGHSRVTVLAYHRIVDPDDARGFRGNVSATPAEFEQHMAWVAERFTPVSLDDVAASLRGRALPDRPLLVTFDDGYRDNLTAAAPVLEQHGIAPAIFLATDHIGTDIPFWWDRVAAEFGAAGRGTAVLPLLGERSWSDPHAIAAEWIAAAKRLGESEKQEAIAALSTAIGTAPQDRMRDMILSWSDVAELAGRGWSIGAHTCTHPILTRVTPDTARGEVVRSVERVRSETGAPVLGFAYPNGQPGDFDDVARRAVAEATVPLAFTLLPGPARSREVAGDPLAVRRVYVHHGDDAVRFAAKASGVPRLAGRG